MVKVTLKDGSNIEVKKGSSILEIAKLNTTKIIKYAWYDSFGKRRAKNDAFADNNPTDVVKQAKIITADNTMLPKSPYSTFAEAAIICPPSLK